MKVFTINEVDYEFNFDNLLNSFEVYAKALNKMVMQDLVTAGSIIVDACFTGTADQLIEIKADVRLYSSLCIQAAGELEIYESKVKKNS
jgi:hypothetical protein